MYADDQRATDDVRVTVEGPVLATLILTEWLQLIGLPPFADDPPTVTASGTLHLRTGQATFAVTFPPDLVYDQVSEPPAHTATIRRLRNDQAPSDDDKRVATYLLRFQWASA